MNLGSKGERLAARFLKRLGYRIVARNYRCPAGEIDIVAEDDDTLVFTEVKSRRSDVAADPEVNVDHRKREQLVRVARYYLLQKSAHDRPARFDVVAVVVPQRGKPAIEHFIDAFSPGARI